MFATFKITENSVQLFRPRKRSDFRQLTESEAGTNSAACKRRCDEARSDA